MALVNQLPPGLLTTSLDWYGVLKLQEKIAQMTIGRPAAAAAGARA